MLPAALCPLTLPAESQVQPCPLLLTDPCSPTMHAEHQASLVPQAEY